MHIEVNDQDFSKRNINFDNYFCLSTLKYGRDSVS